jgi:hypothetical protein
VSWTAAIVVLLVLSIVGGTFWYERSRPPSQIVALVAALAALAVAGRIALAPIPNVVPSTDIIIIAGYVLGGAPGFAVGALTALVSNFWLGQGPWTPWQMAGWGMTGVMGAMLATATRGEVKRLPLALFCAFAGLAYGALLDLSVMVSYGGEQSLDRYLALSARGIPFNLAHAAGNFTLAIVAGPAMVRMLQRYRSRFEFAWSASPRRTGAAAGAAVALLCAVLVPASFDEGPAEAAGGRSGAAAWLRGAQNSDGGFGFAPGVPSSPAMTGWAALGLEAAGVNPLDVSSGGKTPIAYLRSTAGQITTTGDIERTILVLEAAGLDSKRFAGRDLLARLLARRGGDGSWGGQVNPTAFGVLALDAAGSSAGNRGSARWLVASQNADGGWGFAPGTGSEADSTGAVLQALAAAGGGGAAIGRGVAYLRDAQLPGGGFSLYAGSAPNAQSTSWAVQGVLAAGTSPRSLRRGGRTPVDYLAAVQAPDGHYRYSSATDQTPVWVTAQALQAASGDAFPIDPVARSASGGGSAEGGAGGGAGTPTPGGAGTSGTGLGTGAGTGKAKPKPEKPAAAEGAGGTGAATGAPPAAAQPADLERTSSAASGPGEDDGGSDALKIVAILLAAAALLGGGWFEWNRRAARS